MKDLKKKGYVLFATSEFMNPGSLPTSRHFSLKVSTDPVPFGNLAACHGSMVPALLSAPSFRGVAVAVVKFGILHRRISTDNEGA